MEKEILINVLKLDSIYNILDWKDRVRIHLLLQQKIDQASLPIIQLHEWCKKWNWLPPKTRYGQDRLLYFENAPGEWKLIEELKKIDLKIPKK